MAKPVGQLQTAAHGPGQRGGAKAAAPIRPGSGRIVRLGVGGNRRASVPAVRSGSAIGRAAGAVRPARGRI